MPVPGVPVEADVFFHMGVSAAATGDATWYFQCWFRDGASNNFSDALGVTFE
ncbi:MAG: hypothetical protein GY711_26225 [bacterium]|nr:hypothetical protein [bacterium]